MSCSLFISVAYFSDDIATLESHNIFLTSHLNYHERDNHKEFDTNDEVERGHSHTHRHSESEDDHTHKHVNVTSFSEMILFQTGSIFVDSYDFAHSTPNTYHQLQSKPFSLEILRPPINS